MNKLKSNYHTHVKLCGHAIDMTEDYVKVAIDCGYKSLGMSDHGPIPRYMMTEEEYEFNWLTRQMDVEIFKDIYIPDVLNAKEKYKNKIKVYLGLEIEYIPKYHSFFEDIRKELDYMNLAIHFFVHNDKITNGFGEVDYNNVLSYANHAKIAMETGLYNIIVHPDVYMHDYRNENGLNQWDERCEETAKIIIESAIENNVYLELNCGGLYKVTAANAIVGEFGYPRRQFWELVATYKDAKIIIGVDAHDPKQLHAKEIDDAKLFAKELGLNIQEYCDTIEK